MKKALTILFACASVSVTAQWVSIRHDSDYILNEIFFINEDTGFVVGEENSTGLDQLVLRTHDGGITWDTSFFPNLYGMTSLSFPTPSVGYTGGRDCDLIKTIDGGDTWNPCPNFPAGFNDLFDLHFINADTGFTLDVGGLIWRTTDGATTWNVVYSPGQWLNQLYFPNEGNMQFLNDTLAFAALGENGLIVKSIDGGSTWTSVSVSDTAIHVNAIYMIDSDTGIAVGRNGKYVRTINGGTTWSPVMQLAGGNADLMDVCFFNDSVGFIIGGHDYYTWPNGPADYGLIFTTSDAGMTWMLTDSLDRHWLTAMHKVNDSVGYCVGWDGRVLRIGNAAQFAGTEESSGSTGVSVYPNPTTGILNVQVATTETCSLQLYDCLGRIVLESEFTTSAVIELKNFPEGVYYWNVVLGDSSTARGKVLKQ